jgi:histidine ammonia-lyase
VTFEPIIIDDPSELTLDLARRVGFSGATLQFGPNAARHIASGRSAFEAHLAANENGYVYGTTTQPGGRAKKTASAAIQKVQGMTLGSFVSMQVGYLDQPLPGRTVRLILLARLANALSGRSRLTVETVTAIAGMLDGPMPIVPMASSTGPGEVIPLCWALAPIQDLPLKQGEAMSLVNGSPCSTALICEAAISARQQLTICTNVFAYMIEAARAPMMHFDPRLAELSSDPSYRTALDALANLLTGAETEGRLPHQAPVSWRIIPTVLSVAEAAVKTAEDVALAALTSVSDNPAMLGSLDDPAQISMVSTGGFHNMRASRAIDQLNSVFADLTALLGKQTARLIDGKPFGFPAYLCPEGLEGIGGEYLAWVQSGATEQARYAATPATLLTNLEDPDGNQSDVAISTFLAYERNLYGRNVLYSAMATALITGDLASKIHGCTLAAKVQNFRDSFEFSVTYDDGLRGMGQAMRDAKQQMTALSESGMSH